eukprot:Clim_evm4s22 gene=Clim_evmTU4s22
MKFVNTVVVLGGMSAAVMGQQTPQVLQAGVTVDATMPCDTYKYFEFDATEACKDIFIDVEKVVGEPDLYVSKESDNIINPTLEDLTWTSYEWGGEQLTISHWDPSFELGKYYIGVYAYCGEDVLSGDTPAEVKITVTQVDSEMDEDLHGVKVARDLFNDAVRDVRMLAEEYHWYHFCVPYKCADITVDLINCIDPTEGACGEDDAYAYPELLVSNSLRNPTINDYTWKLAQIDRRFVEIKASDPDYQTGHYFVGVYGWCTPDEHCPDPATCGPCSTTDFKYDLTVDVVRSDDDTCTPEAKIEEEHHQEPAVITELVDGEFQPEEVDCNTYAYFKYAVENPCADLKIELTIEQGEADVYISHEPVRRPSTETLAWTSYNWTDPEALIHENITIPYYDPSFVGNTEYYIGVHAYCGGDVNTGDTKAIFSIKAYQDTETGDITGLSQVGVVGANGYHYYHFCVPDDSKNVRVSLANWLDPEECPQTYSWPELLVSPTTREPTIYNHAYKLAQIERRHVDIPKDQIEPGAYFVGVYGWCTPDEFCPDASTCGPCENVARSTYALHVDFYDDDEDPMMAALGACPESVFAGGDEGNTDNSEGEAESESSDSDKYKDALIAVGVILGCAVVALAVALGVVTHRHRKNSDVQSMQVPMVQTEAK